MLVGNKTNRETNIIAQLKMCAPIHVPRGACMQGETTPFGWPTAHVQARTWSSAAAALASALSTAAGSILTDEKLQMFKLTYAAVVAELGEWLPFW